VIDVVDLQIVSIPFFHLLVAQHMFLASSTTQGAQKRPTTSVSSTALWKTCRCPQRWTTGV